MPIVKLTTQQIRDLERFLSSGKPPTGGGTVERPDAPRKHWSPRDAELTATLSVATDSKTGATTAAAKLLVPDVDNPGDLEDGNAITVTNRSLDLSGQSGDYIIVVRVGREWRVIWIDC